MRQAMKLLSMRQPKGIRNKYSIFQFETVFHFMFSNTEDKALKAKSEIETSSHEKMLTEVHLFNFNFFIDCVSSSLKNPCFSTQYSVLYQICPLKSLTHYRPARDLFPAFVKSLLFFNSIFPTFSLAMSSQ